MISAVEALSLSNAQLSPDLLKAADELESQIETVVREHMAYNGVDAKTNETRAPVIAEVNQRFRRAGWGTNWRPVTETHPINKAITLHTGFLLSLFPAEESYKSHWEKNANGVASRGIALCANPVHTETCCK